MMKKSSLTIASRAHVDLPDINVWLALVDETHAHHASAKDYWHEKSSPGIAFCRVTMLGFLRLSTSEQVLSKPLSPREAWDIYHQFLSIPVIRFLPEPPAIDHHFAAHTADGQLPNHLWTDAYLAAFSLTDGCRLISFNKDFKRFENLNWLHLKP